jgi:hypothetical protein
MFKFLLILALAISNLIPVKCNHELAPKSTYDISELLGLLCNFCGQLENPEDYIECSNSEDCLEFVQLCRTYEFKCCISSKCEIISEDLNLVNLAKRNRFGIKSRLFFGKKGNSIVDSKKLYYK